MPDPTLDRPIESTVWVDDAHPAYRRAVATWAEGYHVALPVGMALAAVAFSVAEAVRFGPRKLKQPTDDKTRIGR